MDVLIVDSSVHIIERLEEILTETEGISKIFTALSSEEAWLLYEGHQPSVVLLDIDLPLNSSFPLLFNMKKKNADAVIIILSNQFSDFLEGQCKMAGADYFLDKYHEYEKISGIISALATNKTV